MDGRKGFAGPVIERWRFGMSRETFPSRRQGRQFPMRLLRILGSDLVSSGGYDYAPLNDLYGIIESVNGSSSS